MSTTMPLSQKQIHDRFGELNSEAASAANKARDLKHMAQKAERADLIAQCAAQGHILNHGTVYHFTVDRFCAVCGISEREANSVTSTNLTKGA